MKTTFATAVAALSIFAGASAQAETLRFEFDQAFWGFKPSAQTATAWQADREAAVAANPADFIYMTGGFDYASVAGIDSNFSMTVDYGFTSHTFTLDASLDPDDFVLTDPRGTNFQSYTFGYDIYDSFGPSVTFGTDTNEQYRARLDIGFVYDKSTKTLSSVTARTYLQEFTSGFIGIPCGGNNPGICGQRLGGFYDQFILQPGFQIFDQAAFVAPNNTPPAVPLPASGLMLLSVLGAGSLLGRRRKTA